MAKERKGFRIFKNFMYVVWCIGILAVGIIGGWVNQSPVISALINMEITNTQPKQVFDNKSEFYLLVLGCDEDRDWQTQKVTKKYARSDMMLTLRLDFDTNKVTGISIPRDLKVQLPGYDFQKINAYHYIGGKDLAQKAAEYVLGVSIDRTVILDYDSFKKMVDLVGGVEVFIDKPLKYTDKAGDLFINLKPGRQKLTGEQAMGYVRIRKSDNDYQRQQRQKDFLVSFKSALESKPQMSISVTNAAVGMLGKGLTSREVAAMAKFARAVGGDNIKMGMVPVIEHDHGSWLTLDDSKFEEVLAQFSFPSKAPGYSTEARR